MGLSLLCDESHFKRMHYFKLGALWILHTHSSRRVGSLTKNVSKKLSRGTPVGKPCNTCMMVSFTSSSTGLKTACCLGGGEDGVAMDADVVSSERLENT